VMDVYKRETCRILIPSELEEVSLLPAKCNSGRKIEDELEHPVSVSFLRVIDVLLPIAHRRRWTPNMITTVSAVFGAAAVVLVYVQSPALASACYLASYFFDCMDGPLARRYHQVTSFGDKFDHIKDCAVVVFLIGSAHCVYPMSFLFWGVLVLLCLSAAAHAGLVEAYIERVPNVGSPNNALQLCRILTQYCEPSPNSHTYYDDLKKQLLWSRYGGDASFVMVLCMYLLYCSF
jgi:phosphatidylglycerophosphate synthase